MSPRKPPGSAKDKVLTEKQVTAYLQILKSAVDDAQAAGKSIDKTQSPAAAIALIEANDAKFKANLASHGMSDEEYHWVGERVLEAWGACWRRKPSPMYPAAWSSSEEEPAVD